MSNAVSAQNSQLYISNAPATQAGSPTNFVRVSEVKSFGFQGDRNEIDVTSLDSTAKEYRLGLQDFGALNFEAQWVTSDPGQVLLVAAKASPDPYDFKIVYPDGTTDFFRALVKQWNKSGAVDGVLMAQGVIRVTGPVTSS